MTAVAEIERDDAQLALSFEDEPEEDDQTWDEWFRSLPLDPMKED